MNEKLYDALEVCLQTLKTGADPDSALKLFPDMKEELLPLLETSHQAQTLAISDVPEAILRRSKARVLQHAAGMREATARSRKPGAISGFPRLAVSLAIAFLFLLSWTGLVRASNSALPGDNLYPVKRTWEDVRLVLVISPESREELEIEFEQERLHEVDELLAKGRHETIAFAGVVTEQRGNLWVVSGVPVQITGESRLPAVTVTVGASVMLQGQTNNQGFVEAEWIQLLGSDVILPTSVPTQIELPDLNSNGTDPRSEENSRGENYPELEAPANEDHENNSEEDLIDHNDSGRQESDHNVDQSQENENSEDPSDDVKSEDEKMDEDKGSEQNSEYSDRGGGDEIRTEDKD